MSNQISPYDSHKELKDYINKASSDIQAAYFISTAVAHRKAYKEGMKTGAIVTGILALMFLPPIISYLMH